MKENQNLEFKESWRDDYLKIISAFANSDGGVLYIGVDDNGKALGLSDKDIKKLLSSIPNKIRNKLGLTVFVSEEKKSRKNVLKIEVPKSTIPISLDGKHYIRSGSTTLQLKGNELSQFLLKKMGKTWDSLPSEAGTSEIDNSSIDNFKAIAREKIPSITKENSIRKIFSNLQLTTEDKHLTNAAVLLFGKAPGKFFISATTRVGRFKTPTDIIDTVIIEGNLFKQLELILDAIKKHLNVRFEIKGIHRKDVWDYPLEAIREAVINALIHKDYLSTAEIQIKIYDDKIWIWNPGGLPPQLTIDDLKKEHSSYPRNPLIANAFYLAGLIERWGSGTRRIVDLCREQGLPEPEYREELGGFSVWLYKDIYNEENLRKMGLNERQIKAVLYVKERREISLSDMKTMFPDFTEKTLYRDLQFLVEKNVLIPKGEKKGRRYILKE